MVISTAVMNLLVALIVDATLEARKVSDFEIAQHRLLERNEARNKLVCLCAEMDTNKDGSLTLSEIKQGMANNEASSTYMHAMDLTEHDMSTVFNILDEDRSGKVSYEEFWQEVHKMKTNDTHTLLVFIKHFTSRIYEQICFQIKEELTEIKMIAHPSSRRSSLHNEFLQSAIEGEHGLQVSLSATTLKLLTWGNVSAMLGVPQFRL